MNPRALPYLQMGPVLYKTFRVLQFSFKSFSISRHYIIDGLGNHLVAGDLPLWHSAIFQDDRQLTYYCPMLVRQGVTHTQVKHMFVNGRIAEQGGAHMATGIKVWAHQFSEGTTNRSVQAFSLVGGMGEVRLPHLALRESTHRNTLVTMGMGNVLEVKTLSLLA